MTTVSSSAESGSHTGNVKWFYSKTGYGFITSSDNDDYFVHHSGIVTTTDMFSYLVQGEYVSFDVETGSDDKKQAVNVRGVDGGNLMCETRQTTRKARTEYQSSQSGSQGRTQGGFQQRHQRFRNNQQFQTVTDQNGNTYTLKPVNT